MDPDGPSRGCDVWSKFACHIRPTVFLFQNTLYRPKHWRFILFLPWLGVRTPWAENSITTKVAWLLKSNVPPVGGANSEFFVLVLQTADQKSLKQRRNIIWSLVLFTMISFLYGAIIDITQELLRILFGSLILAFAVNSKYYIYYNVMVLGMQ